MHERTTLQSVYIKAVTKYFDGKRICIGFCSLEELLFRAREALTEKLRDCRGIENGMVGRMD